MLFTPLYHTLYSDAEGFARLGVKRQDDEHKVLVHEKHCSALRRDLCFNSLQLALVLHVLLEYQRLQ
jgi:hypothetical protein